MIQNTTRASYSGSKTNNIHLNVETLPPPHTYNHHQPPYIYTITATTYHYLQPPPTINHTTTQCKLHECKWSSCANGWEEKHQQCKLQRVMSTTCASGEFLLVDGRKNTTCAICKRSGPSNTTLAHVVIMTQCNLRCMVVFSFHHLAIYIYIYIYIIYIY